MDYEEKYLKYKAKYITAKGQLEGGLNKDAVKNSKKKLEKYNRNILILEKAIKGRTNKIIKTEDQKKRGIEKLKKNNTPAKEIDEFIKSMDSEINDIKKELTIKIQNLEKNKSLQEKLNKIK